MEQSKNYEYVCKVHGVCSQDDIIALCINIKLSITNYYCRTCTDSCVLEKREVKKQTVRQEKSDKLIEAIFHIEKRLELMETCNGDIDKIYACMSDVATDLSKRCNEIESQIEDKFEIIANGLTVFNDKLEELNKKHAIAITSLMNRVDEIDGEIDNLSDAIFDD